MAAVAQIDGCTPADIPDSVFNSSVPLIVKGLVADWPVVHAGKTSVADAINYLSRFYQGTTIGAFIGEPGINGRYFYRDQLNGFNFNTVQTQLTTVLEQLLHYLDHAQPPSFYVGSAHLNKLLPGFCSDNNLPALAGVNPLASIWLSNESRIAAHHDVPSNIACCVAGTRRFTLFPPDQLENLYIGPLDYTPAGQAISLVDFHQPDFAQFPKFTQALEQALVAELEPGDALFLPGLWWHHVESLSRFNILVNFWWQTTKAQMGAPMDVLQHALLNIKDLPPEQKKAWRAMFDYYIFNDDQQAFAHIPLAQRGCLAADNPQAARQIRAQLLNKLNR